LSAVAEALACSARTSVQLEKTLSSLIHTSKTRESCTTILHRMSTILGSFQSCKAGNHAASITCNGPSCYALQMIPGFACTNNTSGPMICTNGNKCDTPDNLISSFALQGNGQTITQTHNVTINGLTYHLVGSGGNIINLNGTTAKKSAAPLIPSPGYKLLLLIGVLLLST